MRAALLILWLIAGTASADELVLLVRAHHNDSALTNSTAGAMYIRSGWYGGVWHNSNSTTTVSAGRMIDLGTDYGIALGLATGYRRPVIAMAYWRYQHAYLMFRPGMVAVALRFGL